jgi:hypothetical protein
MIMKLRSMVGGNSTGVVINIGLIYDGITKITCTEDVQTLD